MTYKKLLSKKRNNFVSIDKDFLVFIFDCMITQKNMNKIKNSERAYYQGLIDDCIYDINCMILEKDFKPRSSVITVNMLKKLPKEFFTGIV